MCKGTFSIPDSTGYLFNCSRMDDDLFGPLQLDYDESEIDEAVRGLSALLQEPAEGATPAGPPKNPTRWPRSPRLAPLQQPRRPSRSGFGQG